MLLKWLLDINMLIGLFGLFPVGGEVGLVKKYLLLP